MSKLPVVRPKEALRVFLKKDFFVRKSKSSHVVLKHHDGRMVVIPIHPRPIPKGTLHKILRKAKISPEEFKKLLK